MHTRRAVLTGVGTAALVGCTGGNQTTTPSSTPTKTNSAQDGDEMAVSSPAFDEMAPIPRRYTGDGADVSVPLAIDGVPTNAASLALVVDDPDAPDPPFTHWLCWALPPAVENIPADVPRTERVESLGGAIQGTNDFGEIGYRGPRPPAGDGPHRYRFTVSGLSAELGLAPGADRTAVDDAMAGKPIAQAQLVGTYER